MLIQIDGRQHRGNLFINIGENRRGFVCAMQPMIPSKRFDMFSSDFSLTGPHAFGPKKIYFGHKILMKQPHDCSY